ncbi:ATP-dependent acyl-CoA ligase [soil metagenome]
MPVNLSLKGEKWCHRLELVEPSGLTTDASWARTVGNSVPGFDTRTAVVVVGDRDGATSIAYDELSGHPSLRAVVADREAVTDVAAILFTSGTTGFPKGAAATHHYMIQSALEWVRYTECTEADVLFNPLPLFHVNAQFLTALPPLLVGCRAVVAPTFSASRFWDQIAENHVTQFNYHSSLLAILLRSWPDELPEHRLRIGMGAGASRNDWLEFERRTGVPLVEAYGLTECVTVTAAGLDERRAGSCGLPSTGYDVRIFDPQDREVAPDVVGQIVVRPERPFMGFEGYWNDPAATVAATRNLWFHTGDLGWKDDDGYLWFSDRRNDAIRRRGENISSTELENLAREFPGVVDCAAVGVTADLGENEVLVALESSQPDLDLEALIGFMYPRLPYFAVPRFIRVGALPRNASGRVLKAELKSDAVRAEAWDGLSVIDRLQNELGRR